MGNADAFTSIGSTGYTPALGQKPHMEDVAILKADTIQILKNTVGVDMIGAYLIDSYAAHNFVEINPLVLSLTMVYNVYNGALTQMIINQYHDQEVQKERK